MKTHSTFKTICRWILVAYLSLVIEQFCLLSSYELALLPGENHMGVGFFLINLLIMPFLQLTLTMSGGMFVTVAMVAFALSAYTLKFKMPKNAFAITCGATALVLALVWDIENFHLNSKQFWLLMFGHLLAVGFVFMLGIHSDRIFNRMTEKTGVANEE